MQQIGVLGLGVMGKSLAKNLANKGFKVAVYNLPLKGEEQVVANFAAQNPSTFFFPAKDILQFVESLDRPRKILLMVKSGEPVDLVIDLLQPHLEKGDILIDGGNSHFKDTIKREISLANQGLYYVGMGVSGGEKGALEGPSIMPAGKKEVKPLLLPILEKIAAKTEEGEACVDWIGEDGSGHFVKMVHNGIEYADMQIWAETYTILKRLFGGNQATMAEYLKEWEDTLHHSYLLEITLQILRYQEDGKDILPQILDVAGHKGTGLWTVKEALELGVPIPTIAAAMNSRITSAHRPLRLRLAKQWQKPIVHHFDPASILQLLSDAILAARLIALAEGFHLLSEASKSYNWNLSLPNIAKIWRGGCIIRSKMLLEIVTAFEAEENISHLFESASFVSLLASKIPALQKVLLLLSDLRLPFPAVTAALQSYYALHEGYSSVNLIQAQRDCFGAHGYKKVEEGDKICHSEWM